MINHELNTILQQLSVWILALVPTDHIGKIYLEVVGGDTGFGACLYYLTPDGAIVRPTQRAWSEEIFILFRALGIHDTSTGEEFSRITLTLDKGDFNLAVTYPDQMPATEGQFDDTRDRFVKEFFGLDAYTWVDPEGEADLAMNVEIDGNIDFEDMQPRKPH
jgi:hypothetical protein